MPNTPPPAVEPPDLRAARLDFEQADRIAAALQLDPALRRGRCAATLAYVRALLAHDRPDSAADLVAALVERARLFPDEVMPRECAAAACLDLLSARLRQGQVEAAHRLAEIIAAFRAAAPRHRELSEILAAAGLKLVEAYAGQERTAEAEAVYRDMVPLAAGRRVPPLVRVRCARAALPLIGLEAARGARDRAHDLADDIQALADRSRDPELAALAAESRRMLAMA